MKRVCAVLFLVLLGGCATRPDAVAKGDPLEGLLLPGHVPSASSMRLTDPAPNAGVVLIPSKGSQKGLDYFKAFDEAVRGGTIDVFGFVAQHKASEDPRHSVLFITDALRKCFGEVRVAQDLAQATRMPAPLIAVVDLNVAYPFWGAWTAEYEVVFLDKQGRSIQRVQAQGSKVPAPFQHQEGLVVQQRAAADLNNKLQAARQGKCTT